MKKRIIIISFILIVLCISLIYYLNRWREVEINLNNDYNECSTQEGLSKKEHLKLISEYCTDVTTGYINKDGTKTLYVYASPIRYLNANGQYTLIDTRIANVKNKELRNQGYIYTIADSDIKTYYPKELSNKTGIRILGESEYEFGVDAGNSSLCKYIKANNFIDESKYMLSYNRAGGNGTDFRFYPTTLGSNCEIVYNGDHYKNNISFWLKINNDIKIKKEPGGYIAFYKKDSDDIVAVIQKPLIKVKDGSVSYNSSVDIQKNANGEIKLIFNLDVNYLKKGTIVLISFEMRRNNQPDNVIYSNLPNLEYAYLSNYSVIGNSKDYGIGRLMVRYRFVKLFNLSSDRILDAKYYCYSLTKENDNLEMISILEDWCSITGNWNKNYKTGSQITTLNINNNLSFDITEEVKKWCEEETGQMEHNGIMIKSINEQSNIYNLLLSNDNTLYKNVTIITLK